MAVVRRSNRSYEFLSASDGFLNALGRNAQEVIGRPLAEVFAPAAAVAVEDLVRRCFAERRKQRARDLECVAPAVVIMDVEVRPSPSGCDQEVQLRLESAAATQVALAQLVGSLFEPTSSTAGSLLYINDLNAGVTRAFHNNLTHKVGLSNAFTNPEWEALSPPEDNIRVAEFARRRGQTADGDYFTFDKRVRDVEGGWRVFSARARVFSRNPDGSPAKILGVAYDSSGFHVVNDALLRATGDVVRAEAREREHLGRELHDSTSQLLVGAQLMLGSLLRSDRTDPADKVKLEETSAAIAAALAEVRAFSFLLHPPDLKALGLAQALQDLCTGFGRRVELPITFRAEGAIGRQQDMVEMALFRVAQEALMNVHRHAQAKHAEVRLRQLRNQLQLDVVDDGIGMPALAGSAPSMEAPGVGIAGMRARMANLGGEVLLENRNPGLAVLARLKPVA
ncbi:PAS domain-containing sensor histidine kinase [Phenylobacterium terrae]|uniref:PAS domain-containing sensor histidine kinase n=1 Tax=Phenylobacterium terrae TaxID=2665495 RepID=A0ABW4N6I4_9CAUL